MTMILLAILFSNLMAGFLATASSISSYSILAKNQTLLVHEGKNAVLNWVIVSYPSTSQTVKCTAKNKNIVIATGSYNVVNRRFSYTIPQNSQSNFDFRLHGVVYVQPHNSNMLTLTIKNSRASDSDRYVCTYGQKSSEINLQVYSELVEMGKPVPSIVLGENTKTVSIELCGTPEPIVTMQLLRVVTLVKGAPKPNSNCYVYYFRNLTVTEQKHCGEELRLVYKGVIKTLTRSVKLIVPLSARAPENVHVRVKDDAECAVVRWDGPNIGSCVSSSLAYDVVIYKYKTVVRRLQTSSNNVEVCGIDFLQKEYTVRVRNTLENTNSTWIEGTLILDEKPYDGMQTAIIACAALAGLLIILLCAYCFYRHKYSLLKMCKRERRLLSKSASEEEDDDEIMPLNNTLASSISPKTQTQSQSTEPPQKSEKESKRKTSRKISLDMFSGGEHHAPRKNSAGAAEQNKLVIPNHSTRFYSLQRNIERERKKLEEQQHEQELDDICRTRRNTDSKVFQDFKNNLNFGPRASNDPPPLPPTGPPGSPLYDTLPSTRSSTSNTRSSASTNSNGRSYYEDDERPPLPGSRRRNTTENSPPTAIPADDINNATPLYDVLPRTNSNLAQQSNSAWNNKQYVPINDGQVYDNIPPVVMRNGHEKNGHGIYDVPVRPTTNGDVTASDVEHVPFSSHKKQNRLSKEEIYENR